MAVTPIALLTSQVATAQTSVTVVAINPNGGVITNPLTANDQGITTAEVLYVNPIGPAGLAANGTTFALQPGQSWTVIPGQVTTTTVNAVTAGHKFSGFSY